MAHQDGFNGYTIIKLDNGFYRLPIAGFMHLRVDLKRAFPRQYRAEGLRQVGRLFPGRE